MNSLPGRSQRSIFRDWYWMWAVSAGFVTIMVMYFLTKYPSWLHYSYRGLSLTHEMSYGVWWSAIGLFLAAIIFSRVGMLCEKQQVRSWPWYVLALVMFALCADETGSLHETVARASGWEGLLPFALVIGGAFFIALAALFKRQSMRIIVTLILIGIGIIVSVAGLEFIEHDPEFLHPFWRRARLVGEEASELIAIGIFITAGLMAMKKMGDTDRSFINATRSVELINNSPLVVYLLFVFQLMVTVTVIVPNYSYFPEGNPSAVFPMCLFFCLGILARQKTGLGEDVGFWRLMSVMFFVTSITQMYNFNIFINNLLLIDIPLLVRAPFSWMITLVPFVAISLWAWRKGLISTGKILLYLLLFFLAGLLVVSEMRLRFRVEYLYLAFSSMVAFSCYQIQRLSNRTY